MTLADLEQLGAYHNAGFVDIYYEGRHQRLGTVSQFGDFDMSPEGTTFVNRVMAAKYTEILTHAEPVVDLNPTPISPLPVLNETVEITHTDVGDLSALDALVKG